MSEPSLTIVEEIGICLFTAGPLIKSYLRRPTVGVQMCVQSCSFSKSSTIE